MRLLSHAIIKFIVWIIIRVSYYYLVLKLPYGMRLRFPAPQRTICLTRIALLAPLRGAFRKLQRFLLRKKALPSAPTAPPRFSLPAHHPSYLSFVYGNNFPISAL